tara:strand:- start:917 stop:1045 length:129 start_codon:yes stop_codon:yes gene_type:complete
MVIQPAHQLSKPRLVGMVMMLLMADGQLRLQLVATRAAFEAK